MDGQSEEETALFALIEQDALNKAMMQLSLRDRSLLEMIYVLLKSDSQIGEELGIKANSVRPLLGCIKVGLQRILKEEDHENAKS